MMGPQNRRCMIQAGYLLHSEGIGSGLLPLHEPRCLDAAGHFSVHANGGPELLSFFVQALNFERHCLHQLFQSLVFPRPREYVLHVGRLSLSIFHVRRQGNQATKFWVLIRLTSPETYTSIVGFR